MTEDGGPRSAGMRAPGPRGSFAPGSRIASYVIEQQVGIGGMSVVYRARDDALGRLVALKVLAPALAADEEFRIRFMRESRAVAAVDEPHIVPVYGAGEVDGALYIASRFVADGDLSRLQRAAGGPLPPAQVADLITQVASALDAAHAIGIVHRDVKPGNVLVENIPGRPQHAYLSDFGLSKSTSAGVTGLTVDGHFMGTPDYCAPEQIAGGTVDGRTDQYSLACVAFSLLAGVVPFRSGDALSRLYAHVNSPVPALTFIRPELPSAVDGVLAQGMAKNPAGRYQSCAAFAWALRGALGFDAGARPGATPSYGPSGPYAPAAFTAPGSQGYQRAGTAPSPLSPVSPGPVLRQRPPRRNPRLLVGGAAVAVVLVAGAIAGVVLSSQHGATGGAPRTGTAVLAGSVTAPGGRSMRAAFLSRDGSYIVGASTTSAMYVWSTLTFKLVGTVSVAAGKLADPISLSPDDQTLYAVDSTSSKLYDLDIATGKPTHVYPLPASSAVDYAYDSSVLEAISPDGAVSEISLATGKVDATVRNPGSAAVVAVRSDGAGRYLLIGDANGAAYLVDTQSKQVTETFRYPYSASDGDRVPEISLDGNTVYLPGGSTAPGKIWDTASRSYITPTDPLWPTPDDGVVIATDSKFDMTSPTSVSETVDIWDIAARAHVITVTVPGGVNEEVLSIGPGASELLSTSGIDLTAGTFPKMDIWAIP